MPKFRHYFCGKCKYEDDMPFPEDVKIPKTVKCPECGGKMRQMFGSNVYIDDWTPMTNDGRKDVEHFERKLIINGKYRGRRDMYIEDRMKANIPVNIKEV